MVETAPKKQKKGTITDEDVCSLLQRYPAQTLLSLLREVAQYPQVKIDWNELFNNTSTGIKSPRELQILWRHLAYRLPLSDHNIDDNTLPLDDDSDLEYEVEAFPSLGYEAVLEATNCVRVLACGSISEPTAANNSAIDGDTLNAHASKFYSENLHAASLLRSSNGPLPVSGQNEVLEANVSANNIRKKRKWSAEEDLKLIDGVRKWGEGNWSAMLKEEEKWGRTAGQLSQRWANLKKKQGRQCQAEASLPGVQLSQAQLAARRAIDIALKDNLTAVGNGAAGSPGTSNQGSSSASNRESPITNISVPSQKQPSQVTNTSFKPGPLSSLPKPRSTIKKAPSKHPSVDDTIQRAAVAAGARIASASDADALRKAVQSKKSNLLPPNVHFICTGLAKPAMGAGTASFSNGGQQAKGNPGKPSVPAAAVSQLPKARTMPALGTEQSNASSSSAPSESQRQEDKTSIEVSVPKNKQSEGVQ